MRQNVDTLPIDFGIPYPWYERKDYLLHPEDLERDHANKVRIETLKNEDPVAFGYRLDAWKTVMEEWGNYHTHVILGGNRSSKSTFMARLFVFLLETIPEARLNAYHISEARSIADQQSYIWEALPQRYKDLSNKKSGTYSTTFTQKNGFSGNKLILPPQPGCFRGSQLVFGTYAQYRNDPQVVESFWAHAIWGDEEMPQKMFERLLTRILDVRGRLFLSFTTIQGWSALIADVLGRTKTLKRRRSDLLGREIPVAQESLTRKGTRIHYFWTQDNPFIPSDTIERMRGRPEAEILAIAHGIPTRSSTTKFPKFSDQIHVIKDDELPWKRANDPEPRSHFTFYQVIDPAGKKPWFMIWAAVSMDNTIYVYRDWPDIGYGPWGEPSERPDGSPGPAMKPNGFGIYDYVDEIKKLETEDGVDVFERVIDPRLGNATIPGKEGATSIVSELQDAELNVIPAPGLDENHGLSLISGRLSYQEDKEIGIMNHPRLYISGNCEQLIECFRNYTGVSRNEVWKDGVDVVRYLLEHGADYIHPQNSQDYGKTFSYG